MPLDLRVFVGPRQTRLVAAGDVDIATVEELLLRAEGAGDAAPCVVVDLTRVTFLDTAGVDGLLKLYTRYGDRLSIIASATCMRAIALSGLGDVLPVAREDRQLAADPARGL